MILVYNGFIVFLIIKEEGVKILKKLVVYYSFEGNTRFIANTIAEVIDADILELRPKNEIKTKSFMKFLWGGRQVIMKEKPDLIPFDINLQEYDIIFIGTPVWAWSYAPPLNTFFSTIEIKNKKIALFCCHGGGKGKIFEKMKKRLSGNDFVGEIDFFEPLKRDKEGNISKIKQWARNIINNLN